MVDDVRELLDGEAEATVNGHHCATKSRVFVRSLHNGSGRGVCFVDLPRARLAEGEVGHHGSRHGAPAVPNHLGVRDDGELTWERDYMMKALGLGDYLRAIVGIFLFAAGGTAALAGLVLAFRLRPLIP